MRLSEAILLGDSLKRSASGFYLMLGIDGLPCGCAIGGAILANGGTVNNTDDVATLKQMWPWVTDEVEETISRRYFAVARGDTALEILADYVRSIEPDEPAESVAPSHVETAEEMLKTT